MKNKLFLIGIVILVLLPIVIAGDLDYYNNGYKMASTADVNGTASFSFSNTPFVTGKIGNGMNTYATGNIRSENSVACTFASIDYGIWFKPNATLAIGSNGTLVDCNNGTGTRINRLIVYNTSASITTVAFRLSMGSTDVKLYLNTSQYWNTFNYYSVSFNASNNEATIYFNGALANSSTITQVAGSALSSGMAIGNDRSSTSTGLGGIADAFYLWGYAKHPIQHCYMYNNTFGAENPMSNLVLSPTCYTSPYTNATVRINDAYTGIALSNFSVYENATLIGLTTNGTVVLPYITNTSSLFSFTYNSTQNGGYLNNTITSQNISNNIVTTLTQSIITFTLRNNITNSLITTANFTSNITTNVTHNLNANVNYNISATATGYYTVPFNYTSLPFLVTTYNVGSAYNVIFNLTANTYGATQLKNFSAIITNAQWNYTQTQSSTTGNASFNLDKAYVYNLTVSLNQGDFPYNVTFTNINVSSNYLFNYSILNLTARSLVTNASISNFNASIYAWTSGVNQTRNTTTGQLLYYGPIDTVNVLLNASGFTYVAQNTTLTFGMNNLTMYAYTAQSVNVTFRNELTNNIITGTNITLELISSVASYNYSTTTGTLYFDLVSPASYTLRFGASNYTERFAYINISERSNQNITLYLLASTLTTNVTITVINENAQNVENAFVRVLKYDLASNSYIERETQFTDYAGQMRFASEFNSEYYQFIVEYPLGTVVLTTAPAYIISTSLTLQINTRSTDTSIDDYLNVDSTLTFNSLTNNFRGTFSNSQNILDNACIFVYRTDLNISLFNSSCSTIGSQSGTILVGVTNISGRAYRADMYYNISGELYYVRSLTKSFEQGTDWGVWGLVIVAVITMLLVYMFRESIPLAIGVSALPMVAGSLTGIILIPVWVSLGVLVLAIILAVIVSRFVQ